MTAALADEGDDDEPSPARCRASRPPPRRRSASPSSPTGSSRSSSTPGAGTCRPRSSRMLADADPESYGMTKMRVGGLRRPRQLHGARAPHVRARPRPARLPLRGARRPTSSPPTAAGSSRRSATRCSSRPIGAAPAAAIALDLVETMTEDDVLPDVRCGMARGPIISRLGDVFGTTVNRASPADRRGARPGSVLVDATMARELASLSGFELTGQRRRILRGVGPVTPSAAAPRADRRSPDARPTPPHRARARPPKADVAPRTAAQHRRPASRVERFEDPGSPTWPRSCSTARRR